MIGKLVKGLQVVEHHQQNDPKADLTSEDAYGKQGQRHRKNRQIEIKKCLWQIEIEQADHQGDDDHRGGHRIVDNGQVCFRKRKVLLRYHAGMVPFEPDRENQDQNEENDCCDHGTQVIGLQDAVVILERLFEFFDVFVEQFRITQVGQVLEKARPGDA